MPAKEFAIASALLLLEAGSAHLSSKPAGARMVSMWRLYLLTDTTGDSRPLCELRDAARSFATAIVAQAGAGYWSIPSAPRCGGGVEVWFNLPGLEVATHAIDRAWSARLQRSGLRAARISGRN